MNMINIPRRKICEKMLEFEEALLDFQLAVLNHKNFEKYSLTLPNNYNVLNRIYQEIKVLTLFFLENRKFNDEEHFDEEMRFGLLNIPKLTSNLIKNPNLPKFFISILIELDEVLVNYGACEDINVEKSSFEVLDRFNTALPKLLTIRRDQMV